MILLVLFVCGLAVWGFYAELRVRLLRDRLEYTEAERDRARKQRDAALAENRAQAIAYSEACASLRLCRPDGGSKGEPA